MDGFEVGSVWNFMKRLNSYNLEVAGAMESLGVENVHPAVFYAWDQPLGLAVHLANKPKEAQPAIFVYREKVGAWVCVNYHDQPSLFFTNGWNLVMFAQANEWLLGDSRVNGPEYPAEQLMQIYLAAFPQHKAAVELLKSRGLVFYPLSVYYLDVPVNVLSVSDGHHTPVMVVPICANVFRGAQTGHDYSIDEVVDKAQG